ncbi:putative cell wall binding repeat protein [Kineococcus xinjiangensis]|uniref:Putative cell wall binding repeat protein n=1 Tax=Kineococcus xinjiangensis TaxID=512762 RepID=A0A2S6IFA9_9ACTN|nr:cell wall-binding repeat-containing protein [Kineococcus xinjiangensis]PPK92898.1 putative cell wall binding repeat protein [Kineococcus xinjiangensis]
MTTTRTQPRNRRLRTAAVALAGAAGLVLSITPASAAPGFDFSTRISGPDRYETAVAASKLLYPNAGSATDVVIVNGTATVDGLTASYLSGLKAAPILYTTTNNLPAVSQAELQRLGAKQIWVVGGENVVSARQVQAWRDAGMTVNRLAGPDRYATAAAVALVEDQFAPERVFIASGTSTADALTVGPIAWAKNYPILLTEAGSVPAATQAALDKLQSTNRTVVGGTGRVSDATYASLKATQRIAGNSRQETAALVAEEAVAKENFDPNSIALVGGSDGAAIDALSAAPISGSKGVPLLFTADEATLGTVTTQYLQAQAPRLSGKGWVFGGPNAVAPAAVDAAKAAAQ